VGFARLFVTTTNRQVVQKEEDDCMTMVSDEEDASFGYFTAFFPVDALLHAGFVEEGDGDDEYVLSSHGVVCLRSEQDVRLDEWILSS
jgi:hypothetical protein